ncbi:MAG: hypothetical protein K5765_06720 [Clostridia bacterium]|nr:hypothetical protein [Clostridia bacterium]
MAEQYSHWRVLCDLEHLRAECFAPKEKKVLTIKEIKQEKITSSNGEYDLKPVAYFEEKVLPMVLNVTNCKMIEKLYGTGNIYEWVGKKIQVFATKTKVAKEMVPCLRIEDVIPTTNEITYLCSVCGKPITKQFYEASISKYGKPYCSEECLTKDTKGEDLLDD